MVKAPVAGQVKTRLARGIGVGAATGFYRTMLGRSVRRLGRDPRWRTLLGVTPDTSVWSPVWPSCDGLVPQGRGDLGDRMGSLFDRLPPGPVVIIGSDIPGIAPSDIAAAFKHRECRRVAAISCNHRFDCVVKLLLADLAFACKHRRCRRVAAVDCNHRLVDCDVKLRLADLAVALKAPSMPKSCCHELPSQTGW